MENRKINPETNSHGNKLSTRTNAFHQLFHQRQQPTLSTTNSVKSTHASHNCRRTNATIQIKTVAMDVKPRVAP